MRVLTRWLLAATLSIGTLAGLEPLASAHTAAATLPNLTPATWLTTGDGFTFDSTGNGPYTPAPPQGDTWVHFGVTADAPVTTSFDLKLLFDNLPVGSAKCTISAAGGRCQGVAYLGFVLAGSHTVVLQIDPLSVVAESNESDNTVTRTVTWTGVAATPTALPLAPASVSGGTPGSTAPSTAPSSYAVTQSLAAGWNLVGWRGTQSVSVPNCGTAIANDTSGLGALPWDVVMTFDASKGQTSACFTDSNRAILNSNASLSPGSGLWIHVTQAATWTYTVAVPPGS